MHQTRIFQQPFTRQPFCSGHYIPYITCFFPQPEKPKSRAPSFLEKLATLIFTGLPLLGLSAAKLIHFVAQNTSSQELAPDKIFQQPFTPQPFCSGHYIPYITWFCLPTARKAQKESPFFSRKIGNSTFHWFTSSGPSTAKLTHFITQNTSSQALAPDKNIPAAFYTKAFCTHLHQTPFTPDTFYTRHIFTRNLLDQTPFTLDTFYTRHLLHQTPLTPTDFYTKQLSHQVPFTPTNFYTRQLSHQTICTPTKLLHQTTFTPTSFHTRHLLHKPAFTPDTFYTKHLLHQAPFTPDTFYTRQLSHQTPFTPTDFYTRRLSHQTIFTPTKLLHLTTFTPTSFHTRHLLRKPAFTPDTFYTKHLLHQAPFTPDTFYTRQLSHQTPFTPTDFYTRRLGNSTFHWFASSAPLYNKTPATTSHT